MLIVRNFPASRLRKRPQTVAFTLIEVVVASVLFVIAAMGILSGLLFAYNTAVKVRTHDQAWIVLRALAEQFTDPRQECFTNSTDYKSFFQPTDGEFTGEGLKWPDTPSATAALAITIDYPGISGPSGTIALKAQRRVEAYSSIDAPAIDLGVGSPDLMLRGTFRVTYILRGNSYTEELTVSRSAQY